MEEKDVLSVLYRIKAKITSINMLDLRHLAVLSIDPRNKKFSQKQFEVLKNLKQEIKDKLNTASVHLKSCMRDYDETRKEYYHRLMRRNLLDKVTLYAMKLSSEYNRLMDARNICSATKTWTKNFILMDQHIMTKLACPGFEAHYEELDKILKGMIQVAEQIQFPEELNPMESELYELITEYQRDVKEAHEELHRNDEQYSLDGFSEKLQNAVRAENKARAEYIETSLVYDHLCDMLARDDPGEELLMELITLMEALPLP